jgi:hypothetical protein
MRQYIVRYFIIYNFKSNFISILSIYINLHNDVSGQNTNEEYWQLNNLGVEQAAITVCNSSLSEAAILGFEYGYSLENEMALTIWEAQFGDFANNAQVLLFYYFIILLFYYFIILLFYYFIILLFYYFIILLFYYFVILLFYYFISSRCILISE